MKTQTEIIETLESSIIEIVKESIENVTMSDYGTVWETPEEIEETVNDLIFQMIDGMQEVIYTYKAKEISEIIGIYDAFDTSDMTGERFENWSQVAFENIYELMIQTLSISQIIEKELNKLG